MESEEQRETISEESTDKVKQVSIHIPTIPSEIENNTQN